MKRRSQTIKELEQVFYACGIESIGQWLTAKDWVRICLINWHTSRWVHCEEMWRVLCHYRSPFLTYTLKTLNAYRNRWDRHCGSWGFEESYKAFGKSCSITDLHVKDARFLMKNSFRIVARCPPQDLFTLNLSHTYNIVFQICTSHDKDLLTIRDNIIDFYERAVDDILTKSPEALRLKKALELEEQVTMDHVLVFGLITSFFLKEKALRFSAQYLDRFYLPTNDRPPLRTISEQVLRKRFSGQNSPSHAILDSIVEYCSKLLNSPFEEHPSLNFSFSFVETHKFSKLTSFELKPEHWKCSSLLRSVVDMQIPFPCEAKESVEESFFLYVPFLNPIAPITWKWVSMFLQHEAEIPSPPIPRPLPSGATKEWTTSWNADFVDGMEKNEIFELLLLANYLDIPQLLDLCSARVASLIRGLSREDIRRQFDLEGKLTPEEEEDACLLASALL